MRVRAAQDGYISSDFGGLGVVYAGETYEIDGDEVPFWAEPAETEPEKPKVVAPKVLKRTK